MQIQTSRGNYCVRRIKGITFYNKLSINYQQVNIEKNAVKPCPAFLKWAKKGDKDIYKCMSKLKYKNTLINNINM